jgi:hypothetical protein
MRLERGLVRNHRVFPTEGGYDTPLQRGDIPAPHEVSVRLTVKPLSPYEAVTGTVVALFTARQAQDEATQVGDPHFIHETATQVRKIEAELDGLARQSAGHRRAVRDTMATANGIEKKLTHSGHPSPAVAVAEILSTPVDVVAVRNEPQRPKQTSNPLGDIPPDFFAGMTGIEIETLRRRRPVLTSN